MRNVRHRPATGGTAVAGGPVPHTPSPVERIGYHQRHQENLSMKAYLSDDDDDDFLLPDRDKMVGCVIILISNAPFAVFKSGQTTKTASFSERKVEQ